MQQQQKKEKKKKAGGISWDRRVDKTVDALVLFRFVDIWFIQACSNWEKNRTNQIFPLDHSSPKSMQDFGHGVEFWRKQPLIPPPSPDLLIRVCSDFSPCPILLPPPSSLPPTHHAQLDQLWNGLDLQRGQLTWSMLVGVDRSWSGHFAPRYCTGMCLILQHLQNCCSLLLSLHFLQVSEHLKQTGRLPLLRGKPAAADLYVRSCSDKNRIARLKF